MKDGAVFVWVFAGIIAILFFTSASRIKQVAGSGVGGEISLFSPGRLIFFLFVTFLIVTIFNVYASKR
jgi:hypothetical protein